MRHGLRPARPSVHPGAARGRPGPRPGPQRRRRDTAARAAPAGRQRAHRPPAADSCFFTRAARTPPRCAGCGGPSPNSPRRHLVACHRWQELRAQRIARPHPDPQRAEPGSDPRRQEIINAELRRLDPDLSPSRDRPGPAARSAGGAAGRDGAPGHPPGADPGLHAPFADRYGGTAVASRWPHRVVETLDLRVRARRTIRGAPWPPSSRSRRGRHAVHRHYHLPRFDGDRSRNAAAMLTDLDRRHRQALRP